MIQAADIWRISIAKPLVSFYLHLCGMSQLLYLTICVSTLAVTVFVAGCLDKETVRPQPVRITQPDKVIDYKVKLENSPSDKVTRNARRSLLTFRLRKEGAQGVIFLRRRVKHDEKKLTSILHSQGYYSASVSSGIAESSGKAANVTFTVHPGPVFKLAEHTLTLKNTGNVALPVLDEASLGSPVGAAAIAAEIKDAETAAVDALQSRGFPYAEYRGRAGQVDTDAATLTVDSVISTGSACVFGAVHFEGLQTVKEDYLLKYMPWKQSDIFNRHSLIDYQRRLTATNLFKSVSARIPEMPPDASENLPALPVTVLVEERTHRRVAGGLRYDTDLGPSARASFLHRNFLGANENLRAWMEGGLVEQSVGVGLRKPEFLHPGQDLTANLALERNEDDAFDALTASAYAGLNRRLNREWRVGLGFLAEFGAIDDEGMDADAYLLGLPAFAGYDSTDDLLDPTKGLRVKLETEPNVGLFDKSDTYFLTVNANGSVYKALDNEGKYVLAGRARAASILSRDLDSIPATRRLYAGGGGSVRGYDKYGVGPLDSDNDPVGGRLALELEGEVRARLNEKFGVTGFISSGAVSTGINSDVFHDVQVAAGAGFRYFSPAGPIRVDVAFPLNRRSVDDIVQVYFSIGQAF